MLKKFTPAASSEPFRVPGLGECDPEHERLTTVRAGLRAEQFARSAEKHDIVAELEALPAPAKRVRAGVAALLGDDVDDGPAKKRARLTEVRQQLLDIDEALVEIDRRIAEARGKASAKVCEAVKPEYGRRVAAICEALVAAEKANDAYMDLIDAFEAEDVAWTRLTPMQPSFLGNRRFGENRIQPYLREAVAAGYWSMETAR